MTVRLKVTLHLFARLDRHYFVFRDPLPAAEQCEMPILDGRYWDLNPPVPDFMAI